MIDVAAIEKVYARAAERAAIGRRRLGRGLTLGEKILFNHLVDELGKVNADARKDKLEPGATVFEFEPVPFAAKHRVGLLPRGRGRL